MDKNDPRMTVYRIAKLDAETGRIEYHAGGVSFKVAGKNIRYYSNPREAKIHFRKIVDNAIRYRRTAAEKHDLYYIEISTLVSGGFLDSEQIS